jgi:ketosteroid isomerase-like protein
LGTRQVEAEELTVPLSVTLEESMRYLTYLLVTLSMVAGMIFVTNQPKVRASEQELLNVREARLEAIRGRDIVAWSHYVADDCIFSDDGGVLSLKAKTLGAWEKQPPEFDYYVTPRDFILHLYGNTAVINLRVTVHQQFTDGDLVTELRETETYVKQSGSWLLIAKQWGYLPVNLRKPVSVDANVYHDYVGQYEWRPGTVETVLLKDGRLWSQMGDLSEYLPAGTDTFFLKDGDLGSFTFSRDAHGHVTGYTYQRVDGQEIRVKKIK